MPTLEDSLCGEVGGCAGSAICSTSSGVDFGLASPRAGEIPGLIVRINSLTDIGPPPGDWRTYGPVMSSSTTWISLLSLDYTHVLIL